MDDNFNYNNANNNKKSYAIMGLAAIISICLCICICVFMYFKFNDNNNNNVDISKQNVMDNNINKEDNSNNETKNIISSERPKFNVDDSFLMQVEDVTTFTGRGTVITGTIQRGTIKVNDQVQIIGLDKETKTTTVVGIERYGKTLDSAAAGVDIIGLLLKGIAEDDVERGQVVAEPNTISARTKFSAEAYILKREEGGRKNPFSEDYRPNFYFRTIDITGEIKLPNETKMVMPGDTINLDVALMSPVAMEIGTTFNIREGGRVVGRGKVTKIYE